MLFRHLPDAISSASNCTVVQFGNLKLVLTVSNIPSKKLLIMKYEPLPIRSKTWHCFTTLNANVRRKIKWKHTFLSGNMLQNFEKPNKIQEFCCWTEQNLTRTPMMTGWPLGDDLVMTWWPDDLPGDDQIKRWPSWGWPSDDRMSGWPSWGWPSDDRGWPRMTGALIWNPGPQA